MLKEQIISKMKKSESISELNSHLIQFFNTVKVTEEWIKYNDKDYVYSLSDTMKLFEIKKYKLCNYWSHELSKIGIPVELSDYPKIQEAVNEVRELNKTSSDIHKKFNTHRKAELKRIKSESPGFQTIKSELDDVLEEIRLLDEKRHNLQVRYTSCVNNMVNKIEKDAGFVNHNIRLAELNEKLKQRK